MTNQVKTLPAQDTPLQRLTCKWLAIGTAAVFVVVAVVGLVVPSDLIANAVRWDLYHSAITAGLLYWGWSGSTLGRHLGGLGVAAGLLHLAPVLFFVGFLVIAPDSLEVGLGRVGAALVYFAVLLVYYLGALAFIRRANLAARPTVPATNGETKAARPSLYSCALC